LFAELLALPIEQLKEFFIEHRHVASGKTGLISKTSAFSRGIQEFFRRLQ
jgi:hypothetical protein